ncbi:MAG: DNA starvation/stationary phase protection protein [Alphaproteobacteria bacterium]|nr:DNA starvation/stationary phase protection protein [Alphaproteobacteria bacterium]
MNPLLVALQKTLGDTFNFYLKAQYYHWNVEGIYFYSLHKFFGEIYEDAQGATDTIAELIRTLDAPAPGHKESSMLSSIMSDGIVSDGKTMAANLEADNNLVIISLMTAYKIAEEQGEIGISNALQDRITIHQKNGWMLRATAK